MIKITKINESIEVFDYLEKRNLLEQYKKSKNYILNGIIGKTDFKLRQPKTEGVFSFRINNQYRAFGRIKNSGILIVYQINNHSNF